MTKYSLTAAVVALLVICSVALAAGENQFDDNPGAPVQYASAYPPPVIINVPPAPAPSYPPPAYMAPQVDKGMDPLSIVGAILLIAAVVTTAVALLVRNSQRGVGNNRPNNTATMAGTTTAQLRMMEGASSALTIGPDGAVGYVTGMRPAGSATMPAAQTADPATPATPEQRAAALAALAAALGATAPTLAQRTNAINWVVSNWAGYRGRGAARTTAINADVASALALGAI